MGYRTKKLDHLGIVAGICERIQLVEQIDSFFPEKDRKVSVGLAVKAMILNALGFSSRPLYLSSEFFENKPVETLLGQGLEASDLNDDSLGRALDALFQADVTTVFAKVASHTFRWMGIPHTFVHLDSTTLSLHGQYYEQLQRHPDEPVPIHLTKGYSKDQHPELKQLVCSMICAYKTSIPLWMEALDGNASDKTSFPKTIEAYLQQVNPAQTPCFIVDSAFYTEENLRELEAFSVSWLTRVPETIAKVKEYLYQTKQEQFSPTSLEGYSIFETHEEYAGIQQRWLIVSSEKAFEREKKTLDKRREKEQKNIEKALKALEKKRFLCQEDATKRTEEEAKGWSFTKVKSICFEKVEHHEGKGRPKKDAEPTKVSWKLKIETEANEEAVKREERKLGRFVLGTNLAKGSFSSEEALESYKAQGSSIERGFRFLKDPMFFSSGLYLQKPSRIMALVMVMCLSLLVYSFAEHELRSALRKNNDVVPDQKGNPTQQITMRRVFQMFEGIDVLWIETGGPIQKLVLNMNEIHQRIVSYLGKEVRKCYLLE